MVLHLSLSDDDDDDNDNLNGGVVLSNACQESEAHWKKTSTWLTND